VDRLFFLLSGENETLPASELKAILEAEKFPFKILETLDQVLRLEADSSCVEAIKRRAALTRICAAELFTCDAKTSTIIKAIQSTNLNKVLEENDTFAVRIRHVKAYSQKIDTMTLERKLGNHILKNTTKTKVNLKNPDKTFTGILTNEKLIFGVKLAETAPKPFVERRPRKKPFFHPSAMPPKLARCMVNLAQPRRGDLVLDPFCGTGSILIEAALISCRILGLDIKRRMIRGCSKNLNHFAIEPEGLILTDGRKPPITQVNSIVTDPPYGRSATTLRLTTKQIVEDVLTSVQDLLNKGQRICIASPKTLNIACIATEIGYKHLESHFAYVHRTLTREIAVLKKV